jgi:hypothetical protein
LRFKANVKERKEKSGFAGDNLHLGWVQIPNCHVLSKEKKRIIVLKTGNRSFDISNAALLQKECSACRLSTLEDRRIEGTWLQSVFPESYLSRLLLTVSCRSEGNLRFFYSTSSPPAKSALKRDQRKKGKMREMELFRH